MYAKLAWEKYTDEQIKDVMAFNEGYKNFITNGKTERFIMTHYDEHHSFRINR